MSLRTIVEERPKNVVVMDVFSKLVQERIIFIDDSIDDELANGIIAQMLYLDSISNEKINIYINTPGGSVHAGLGIYDVGMLLKSPIKTVCVGVAASMGAILMLMGEERVITKHARMMIHQPMGGAQGQASDIRITSKEIDKLQHELYQIIAERTGTPIDTVANDADRDYWMTSEEALAYGMVTKILNKE